MNGHQGECGPSTIHEFWEWEHDHCITECERRGKTASLRLLFVLDVRRHSPCIECGAVRFEEGGCWLRNTHVRTRNMHTTKQPKQLNPRAQIHNVDERLATSRPTTTMVAAGRRTTTTTAATSHRNNNGIKWVARLIGGSHKKHQRRGLAHSYECGFPASLRRRVVSGAAVARRRKTSALPFTLAARCCGRHYYYTLSSIALSQS